MSICLLARTKQFIETLILDNFVRLCGVFFFCSGTRRFRSFPLNYVTNSQKTLSNSDWQLSLHNPSWSMLGLFCQDQNYMASRVLQPNHVFKSPDFDIKISNSWSRNQIKKTWEPWVGCKNSESPNRLWPRQILSKHSRRKYVLQQNIVLSCISPH